MDFGLKGKRVLITGAADGLGKCLAKIFNAEGAHIIMHDLQFKEDMLKKNCSEIGNCEFITADLSVEEQVDNMCNVVREADVLVNNAGIWPTAYVKEMTTDAFK